MIKEKVISSLKSLKNRRAPRLDHIPTEIFTFDKEDKMYVLIHLVNSIYKSGLISEERLLRTYFFVLPRLSHYKFHEASTKSLFEGGAW